MLSACVFTRKKPSHRGLISSLRDAHLAAARDGTGIMGRAGDHDGHVVMQTGRMTYGVASRATDAPLEID